MPRLADLLRSDSDSAITDVAERPTSYDLPPLTPPLDEPAGARLSRGEWLMLAGFLAFGIAVVGLLLWVRP